MLIVIPLRDSFLLDSKTSGTVRQKMHTQAVHTSCKSSRYPPAIATPPPSPLDILPVWQRRETNAMLSLLTEGVSATLGAIQQRCRVKALSCLPTMASGVDAWNVGCVTYMFCMWIGSKQLLQMYLMVPSYKDRLRNGLWICWSHKITMKRCQVRISIWNLSIFVTTMTK